MKSLRKCQHCGWLNPLDYATCKSCLKDIRNAPIIKVPKEVK